MADYSRFLKRHARRLLDEERHNEKFRRAKRLMHPAQHIDMSKLAAHVAVVEAPKPPPAPASRTLH
jgi:hypothetical protein